MKKIYSFVLMATMLLMGTNAWAGTSLNQVQTALNDAAVTGITLSSDYSFLQFDGQLVLDQNKHFVLDLGGLELRMNNTSAAKNAAILVKRGTLEIKNGSITNLSDGTNYTVDLIRVIGTTETGWDAAAGNPYAQVIIANGAEVYNTKTASGKKFNALTITEVAAATPYSNGARIDVYGYAEGTTYGIKVNGTIQKPADVNDAPYVYVHAGATVKANQSGSGSVAVYASGYGRWRIEGSCEGSTGLYAKGGDIDIVGNAVIASNNADATAPTTGGKSGVNAGGSAIVIESNANYPGNISVTIADEAEVKATSGYAIEETVDNAVAGTKVESISIQGGEITGGSAGAIIVDQSTKDQKAVTVVGGYIDGTMAVETGTNTMTVEQFINGTTTDPEHPDEEADYLVTTTGNTDVNPTYKVEPNLSKVVTMNAYGFSTFSTDKNRKIKAADTGLKAYTAVYKDNGDLELTLISDGIIPADNGVILWGALDHTYSLEAVEGNYSLSNNNDLRPESAWESRDQNNTFFVLSGNLMYKYIGSAMKEHKAYLEVAAPIHAAPARIRMIIAEPQAVENVATEADKAQKFIENGQVLIKRGERVYNVQGQIVK